jgi:type IV secretory pathway VirB6-like protein
MGVLNSIIPFCKNYLRRKYIFILALFLYASSFAISNIAKAQTKPIKEIATIIKETAVVPSGDFFSSSILDPACRTESRFELREYNKDSGLYRKHFVYNTKYAFVAPKMLEYYKWRCLLPDGSSTKIYYDTSGKVTLVSEYYPSSDDLKYNVPCSKGSKTAPLPDTTKCQELIDTYVKKEQERVWNNCVTKNYKNKAFFKDMYIEAYDVGGSGRSALIDGNSVNLKITESGYEFVKPFDPSTYSQLFAGTTTPEGGSENGLLPVCTTGCWNTKHPLSAVIVECIEGTMNNLFVKPQEAFVLSSADDTQKKQVFYQRTVFQNFQSIIRTSIVLLIIIYLSYQGFQTVMGEGLAKDGTKGLIMNVIKIAAVSYFAIGDAWKDYFLFALKDITAGFAGVVQNAVAGGGMNYDGCFFQTGQYPPGKAMLAIFDSIDCKFANYIGYLPNESMPAAVNFFAMYIIFPLFGQIMCFLMVLFTLFLFNFFAVLLQMYLGATIYLAILLFISPITITMSLFSNDIMAGMFKGWLDKIINLSLYQILTVLMFAVTIPMLDTTIYGENYHQKALFIPYDEANNSAANGYDATVYASIVTGIVAGGAVGAITAIGAVASSITQTVQDNTSGSGSVANPTVGAITVPRFGPITQPKMINPDCEDTKGSITCALRRSQYVKIMFPIPGWVEMFPLMFPKVSGGGMMAVMIWNLLKACGIIFLIQNLTDSFKEAVTQLTKAGGAASMINDIKFDNPAKLAGQAAGATAGMSMDLAKGADNASGGKLREGLSKLPGMSGLAKKDEDKDTGVRSKEDGAKPPPSKNAIED